MRCLSREMGGSSSHLFSASVLSLAARPGAGGLAFARGPESCLCCSLLLSSVSPLNRFRLEPRTQNTQTTEEYAGVSRRDIAMSTTSLVRPRRPFPEYAAAVSALPIDHKLYRPSTRLPEMKGLSGASPSCHFSQSGDIRSRGPVVAP